MVVGKSSSCEAVTSQEVMNSLRARQDRGAASLSVITCYLEHLYPIISLKAVKRTFASLISPPHKSLTHQHQHLGRIKLTFLRLLYAKATQRILPLRLIPASRDGCVLRPRPRRLAGLGEMTSSSSGLAPYSFQALSCRSTHGDRDNKER